MTVQRKAIQQYRQSYQSQEAVRSYDEEASASFRSHRSLRGIINALTVRAEQSTLTKVMARIPAGGTILDVPCGTGKEFPVLRGRGRVIGADSSIAMLGLYVRRGGVESMRADISLLPLRNQSVDVVVCNRFLHRLPPSSRAIVLSELRRVTRRWAVTYHGIAGPGRRFVIAFERALGLGERGLLFLDSESDIRAELKETGWKVVMGRPVIMGVSTGFVFLLENPHGD